LQLIEPIQVRLYGELYEEWREHLSLALSMEKYGELSTMASL
jgi:hypothetical protein